ncbi:hypothetical protein CHS0354_030740 [Potamilus streckersoni]|uniref:Uncharacterized protein n=1 Tax=Potamilus streckersoni TaxID=2493646 RepID=A0AAE0RLP4_9BIVA|nr:hypothetical protein CHS0354_030740 [Potamilus streckersoni]
MGNFVAALVLLELFWIINLSYTHTYIDGYNSLHELADLAYDDLYPLSRYSFIDPYRFVGLGHSELYHTGGRGGYSNLGTYGFSGGGTGYSNLWRYLIRGSKDLGDYGHLGQYNIGGYNNMYNIDDVDYGRLYRRYSSLGSYQQHGSRYLGSYNNIGGYSNLGPYNFGGNRIGNDVGLLSYLSNNDRLNDDQYYPGVYSFVNRAVPSRPRKRNTYK